MLSSSTSTYREPKPLHGVPGNLYILKNTGLRDGFLQIGLSRRSGWAKALELNRDKNNTIPGSYECVFELRTQDGGAALEAIFQDLHPYRRGRREQDFFEIDQAQAMQLIEERVREADVKLQTRYRHESTLREYLEAEKQADAQSEMRGALQQAQATTMVREGIFKKAFAWVTSAMIN